MHPFQYTAAANERLARDMVAGSTSTRYLAGGTTLIDLMKLDVERPTHLVDITTLPLAGVEALPSGGIRVGATVRNSDLAHHELVRTRYPVLSQALLAGASPQLRNMATTGGNLLQRTRCYYFRDVANSCNKREPGSGCPAIAGYNRIHAILGTSEHCIATHASDMAVALVALDAVVRVRGPAGERAIPIGEFYIRPGPRPDRETTLRHGELIVAVDLPALPWATRSLYLKVRDRASYAFALTSAAVALDLENDVIREARIALGGVATIPWRARGAEAALVGGRLTSGALQAAAQAAVAGAVPRAHNAFKIELAKRTVVRALTRAGAMT